MVAAAQAVYLCPIECGGVGVEGLYVGMGGWEVGGGVREWAGVRVMRDPFG